MRTDKVIIKFPTSLMLCFLALAETAGIVVYHQRLANGSIEAIAAKPVFVSPQFTIQEVAVVKSVKAYHGGGGINDAGNVVGGAFTSTGELHGFMWKQDGSVDLGTLDGGSSSAWAINNMDQIVGRSETATGVKAFLWERGHMHGLPMLRGFTNSTATGINDRGQVVGRVYRPTSKPYWTWAGHAVLWDKDRIIDLGVPPGCINSQAAAINEKGQVVGRAVDALNQTHAFVWEQGRITDLNSVTKCTLSAAVQINNTGQIAGSAGEGAGMMRAVVWERTANGRYQVRRLSPLPFHTDNLASAVTDTGVVYGSAKVGREYAPAVTWASSGFEPPKVLSYQLPAGSSWFVSQVFGVNRRNQILVFGYHENEQEHLAVLTPTPQSSP